MARRSIPLTLVCFAFLCAFPRLHAWNAVNHRLLTRTLVDSLPAEQRALIGGSEADLVQKYCLIPDTVRADPKSPFLRYVTDLVDKETFDSIPESKRQTLLHIADRRANNAKVYAFYVVRTLDALQRGDRERGFIYLGTFLHFLQDSICPAHLRYGGFDNPRTEAKEGPSLTSLTFFRRFIEFPKSLEKESLHKRIDRCEMSPDRLREALAGRKPRLLGTTRAGLLEALTLRHEEAMASVDKLLLPLLQALAAEDARAADAAGEKAGLIGACLTADICHSIFELAHREAAKR